MSQAGFDVTQVSPEQFAALVAQADDAQILEVIRGVGHSEVLDRIFEGFRERFRPERAEGVDATMQFVISDDGEEFPYWVKVSDGACATSSGRADDPKVTVTTDVVSFSKLVAGQAEGPALFMAGKLKLAGDMMFSMKIMSFFDRPKAQT
jgi:putative sterol carrier protein